MICKIIEATNGINFGKFMVCRFSAEEWAYRSRIEGAHTLLRLNGWDARRCVWVLDLQTGEGALFSHGGLPVADLEKHKIWVCPLYEPFLEWLYKQDIADITCLPEVVELKDAPSALYGYRRSGPTDEGRGKGR